MQRASEPLESELAFGSGPEEAQLRTPFCIGQQNTVLTGATSAIASFQLQNGYEGLLMGFAFQCEAMDYATSPVAIYELLQNGVLGRVLLGPFSCSVGDLQHPFLLPCAAHLFLQAGGGVALGMKNNAAADQICQGVLVGTFYNEMQQRNVRERSLCSRGGRRGGVFGGA